MVKEVPRKIKQVPRKIKKFADGQVWLHTWTYNWASFGDLPPVTDKYTIIKRTSKMIKLKTTSRMCEDDKVYTAKIHTEKDGHEYFITGRGTGTKVFNTTYMVLQK